MFVFTPNTSQIISDFGNKRAFARHYELPYSNMHVYLFAGKTPLHMRPHVLKKFRQMEADGYITIEYRNGN
ncbi:hypothetical protein [Helicobacter salomonis]|uniref:hypothetical protein n=1 Tax=Helicobacter salomonis TaxID=56878 RepID=UPI000CF1477E|nr:hypothetical protein [Helicobacter salomonis]